MTSAGAVSYLALTTRALEWGQKVKHQNVQLRAHFKTFLSGEVASILGYFLPSIHPSIRQNEEEEPVYRTVFNSKGFQMAIQIDYQGWF